MLPVTDVAVADSKLPIAAMASSQMPLWLASIAQTAQTLCGWCSRVVRIQRPCRCTSTAHVLTVPYRQPGPRVGIFCEYLPLQMASYQPAIIPSTLFFTHPSLASRLISKSGWEAASPIAALKRTAVQSTPPYGNVHLQVGYSSNLIGIGQCRSYGRECVRSCRRLLHHLHTSELSLGRHVGINPKNERSLKCSTGGLHSLYRSDHPCGIVCLLQSQPSVATST